MAWSSNPKAQWSREYTDYRKDPWIQLQKRYLDIVQRAQQERRAPVLDNTMQALRQAIHWYKSRDLSSSRYRIEPLLLTDISFDTIALDIGGERGEVEPDVFRAYERLFFNIRYDDGTLSKSCQLCTYFSNPDGSDLGSNPAKPKQWRVCGARLGYSGLMSLWTWEGHGQREEQDIGYISRDAWKLAQSTLIERLLGGSMNDFDFINQLGKIVESGRLIKDVAPAGKGNDEIMALLFNVLHTAAPEMKKITMTVDKMESQTAEMAARLASQKLATGIGQREMIVDAGPERLDAIIKDKIKK